MGNVTASTASVATLLAELYYEELNGLERAEGGFASFERRVIELTHGLAAKAMGMALERLIHDDLRESACGLSRDDLLLVVPEYVAEVMRRCCGT